MSQNRAYTENELRQAVDNCSANPVHIPETIQGFGALIACDLEIKTVLRASANTQALLGVDAAELLGASPSALLTRQEMHELRNRLGHPTIETQREVLGSRRFGKVEMQISVHKKDGQAIIEFMPEIRPAEDRVRMFEQARLFLTMPLDDEDLPAFLTDATERMRAINGYDRVKFYRFLPDDSGEVVAESLTPDMPSYLGLRFPESDIPVIARQLYTQTPFRVLHDIHSDDVPLLGGEGREPLDMSLVALRGLDLVHRQYLKNMDVGGTLSISVVVDGKLWGLIACHNRQARPIDPSMLLAVELAGKLIGLRIQHALENKRHAAKRQCTEIANKFLAVDDSPLAIESYWQRSQQELLRLVRCDGIAIMVGQETSSFQDAPPKAALHALFSLLGPSSQAPFVADDLQSRMPGATWGKTAGAMAFSFGEDGVVKLAFLRNLASAEVSWAGAPEKDVTKDAYGIRLNPRNSFETYIQRVEGRSVEWTADDLDTGHALLEAFREAFSVQKELSENRHRLGLMVRELNHRVRNILALVQSISVYSKENASSVAAYTESLEQRIVALAGAHNLLTRADMEGALLKDILAFELGPFTNGHDRITITGPDVVFRPEAVSVAALLIHELTSNAAKYGALSVSEGQVNVAWDFNRGGVDLTWQETGGPPVTAPERAGFGRSIIEDAIPYEFKGEAEIRFEPGGVQARFWLPDHTIANIALPSIGEQEKEDTSPAPLERSGLKGLIVEDNYIVSKVAEQMLGAAGFDTLDRAATVGEALALLSDAEYDLCLLDVNLRGELSLPVARLLDERQIPFIFTSGYGSEGHEVMNQFDAPKLTKPVEPEKLRKTISRIFASTDHA